MLFKTTLKVASATALWMVALLGANSAMAQAMIPTYSAEALIEDAGATMFGVNSPTNLTAALPVANPGVQFDLSQTGAENNLYLRVAPVGMGFVEGRLPSIVVQTKAAPTEATPMPAFVDSGSAVLGTAATMAPGGAMLYTIEGVADRLNAAQIQFLATITAATGADEDEATVSGVGTAGVTMTLYDDERDGYLGNANSLVSGSTNFFHVQPSVKVASATATPTRRTASAEAQFRQFVERDRTGMKTGLGGFHVTVDTMHRNAAGVTLAVAHTPVDDGDDTTDEVLDMNAVYAAVGINTAMSSSKFYGEDGQGFDYASKFELNSEADCSGHGPGGVGTTGGVTSYPGMEVKEGEDAPDPNEVIGGIAPNPWYLCVTVDADNEDTIPMGNILMDVTLADSAGATMTRLVSPGAANMTGVHVSEIEHDGTTVQIPYVSTYDQYNQRLVIMNRGKSDVHFSVEFQTEEENGDGEAIMVTSENPATMLVTGGMLVAGGGQTTVMRMRDLVTIENSDRASATVVLQAGASSVDVATTIVNTNDGSTDTIVYDKN